MERSPSGHAARAVLAVLATAALLAPVFVLHALPATELDAVGLGWVIPALAVGLLGTAGAATIASLATGLRYGSLVSLLLAGGSAALVGGALARLSGGGTIALSILTAAGLMLAAAVAERLGTLVPGRQARLVTAGVLLIVAEAMVIAEVIPTVMDAIAPYHQALLAAAAVLAGVASIVVATRDLAPAAVAMAVGATALALARGEGAELAVGLAALSGAGLLTARSLLATERTTNEIDGEALPALATQLAEGVLRFDGHLRLRSWNPAAAAVLGLDEGSAGSRLEDLLGLSLSQLPATSETVLHRTPVGGLDLSIHREPNAMTVVVHDPGIAIDADRLGRELRRTIEDLLQARRTVELQRAELERATAIDPLTGVSSRGSILDRLRIEVSEARRYQHPVAVVLLDVDHSARSTASTASRAVMPCFERSRSASGSASERPTRSGGPAATGCSRSCPTPTRAVRPPLPMSSGGASASDRSRSGATEIAATLSVGRGRHAARRGSRLRRADGPCRAGAPEGA